MRLKEAPVKPTHRIDLLDIYRGFAVFGIFVVNIVIMNSTFLNQDEFALQWTSTLDVLAEKILQLFFYTKFFPIFSLLFGLGISMQALKMMGENRLSFSFFGRRMLILFVIGWLHILFLWSGDVVHLYAILGLFTTLLIKVSNKIILGLSAFFLLLPFQEQFLFYILDLIKFQPHTYLKGYTGANVHEIISNGSYLAGVRLRVLEYASNVPMLYGFLAPIAASMFLLGLYLGKTKVYQQPKIFLQKIQGVMIWIAIITNLYRLVFLFVLVQHELFASSFYREIFIKLMVVSDVAVGLFYLWVIGKLYYYTRLKKLFLPLRYVGRMALTNYIIQSFLGLLIFSSLGFQLYEKLSPMQAIVMAILVFIAQVVMSKIWLTYYRFGPLEWVWRCLTYKKLLQLKKV